MGMLLCEQHFRDVWSQNESIRAETGQILHTDTRGKISSRDLLGPVTVHYIEVLLYV